MGGSWSWRKSSASTGGNGDCVEIAWTGETVLVRDSKNGRGPVVAFGPAVWEGFLGSLSHLPPSGRRTTDG
ncbi:DUF397 domain-containing protein [Streptomyces sp. 142MFCol3.1]|uniref:DUF397 domain-containing protein n=1 Tax=Streptomyces sp. 142MFCol3.1 TaxID=1172179 RepID=UPI0003FD6911|nr:DUF397 domain-containing protein [Streptomyces sp. 142MFCol3.1]